MCGTSLRINAARECKGCVYVCVCIWVEKQAQKSGLPGLPGIARKRLPAFSAAPLPWLVAPAIAGAEFDSSTKNEHETQHQERLLFTKEGARRNEGSKMYKQNRFAHISFSIGFFFPFLHRGNGPLAISRIYRESIIKIKK